MTWILPAPLVSSTTHHPNSSDTSLLAIPVTVDSYLLLAVQVLATMSPSQRDLPWPPGPLPKLLSHHLILFSSEHHSNYLLIISPPTHTHIPHLNVIYKNEGLSVFFPQLFLHPPNQMTTPRSHYSLPGYTALFLSIHSSYLQFLIQVLPIARHYNFRNMKCICPIHHYFSTTHVSPLPRAEIDVVGIQ